MSEAKKMRGFTLVELLVVMAILAVLIALSIAGLGYAMRRSRNVSRLAAVENIVVGMESYYTDNQEYPATPALGVGFANLLGPSSQATISPFLLQEYLEGTFDAPPESHFYILSDLQLYTACVNQEVWTGSWEWSCQGTGVGASGFPVREPAAADTLTGSGTCGEWDGDLWQTCSVPS